jgi:hypothetical protein
MALYFDWRIGAVVLGCWVGMVMGLPAPEATTTTTGTASAPTATATNGLQQGANIDDTSGANLSSTTRYIASPSQLISELSLL